MSKEKILYTAALLHDIGKFIGRHRSNKEEHESYIDDIEYLFPERLYSKEDIRLIKLLVRNHHWKLRNFKIDEFSKEEKELLEILVNSDHESAKERDELKDDKTETKNLMKIILSDDKYMQPYAIINVKELEKSYTHIFEWKTGEKGSRADYKTLNIFIKYLEKLKEIYDSNNSLTWKDYIDSILAIMKIFLPFVPSDTYKNKPNISLYSHLKTTALASQIFLESPNKYYIIVVEINGIQKFIFSSVKREVIEGQDKFTKYIRGKSIFVNLLIDAIWRYFKKELDLFDFNLIRDTGSLVIFAPHRENIEERIKKIELDVNKYLYEYTGLKLSISVSYEKFTNEDGNMFADISEKLGIVLSKINRYEFSKFLEIVKYEEGVVRSEDNICKLCNLNPANSDGICNFCNNLINIGEKSIKIAGNKMYLIISEVKNDESYSLQFKFGDSFFLSYTYSFNPKKNPESSQIIFNNISIENIEITPKITIKPSGLHAPKKENELKTFEELAKNGNTETKLALLKMDVDNLSDILRKDSKLYNHIFKEEEIKDTLSKMDQIVFTIDYFFSTYINKLSKDYDIYVIYSGGDDTSVIGRIDNIINFTKDFTNKFKSLLSKLTMSGGISIRNHKYPLRNFIQEAEQQLDISKNIEGKSSITTMNLSVKFQDWDSVVKNIETLYKNSNDKSTQKLYKYLIVGKRMLDSIELFKSSLKSKNSIIEIYPNILYLFRDSIEEHRKRKDVPFENSEMGKIVLEPIKDNSEYLLKVTLLSISLFLLLERYNLDLTKKR